MYTYLSSNWLQENDATHPTYLSGPMDTQKSRYSSPVDHRSLNDLWLQITRWSVHKYIHNVTKVMCTLYVRCALSVLRKECRKVWSARYMLGVRYRSENVVIQITLFTGTWFFWYCCHLNVEWLFDKCNSNCEVKSLWPFMITPVIFKILQSLILSVLYSIILCSISMQFQCNYMMEVGSF